MQTKLKSCWVALNHSSCQHDIFIDIDGVQIRPSTTVRNLGVLFDSALCFHSHIGQIVKSCFYQLRNIVCIRPSLNFADAETIIHAFITSRLDYRNSLYSGLPAKVINCLQMVQNSAARALTFNKKICTYHSHPSPTSLASGGQTYSVQTLFFSL